mmetsp:Transcript_28749/g.51998  ORF Transcript_28749/g.51998 Transcript_28749/m.51998 type:complete len:174 (+) Transcript_28749:82-603(+)
MNINIFLNLLIALLVTSVEGFAPLSSVTNTAAKQCAGRTTTNTHANSNANAAVLLSASQDSNQGDKADEEEMDDYDFEAGFQQRLEQEGGISGVQAKATKRSVDSVKRDVTGSFKSNIDLLSTNEIDLLPATEWNLTLGFLALVVVLAVGTHLSSPQPFELNSDGEQLGFGVL